MRRQMIFLSVLLALTLCEATHAKLNGKNVVYVHGLQPAAMFPPMRFDQDLREEDARGQAGNELGRIFEDYLYYNSSERLQQNEQYLEGQIRRMERAGTCSQGCYLVTSSTGDLVTRYVLSKLNHWRIDISKFWIIATFDLVGAGGGTELADLGAVVADGNPVSRAAREAIASIGLPEIWLVGIGTDLRPRNARDISTGNYGVPRYRIAGRGTNRDINVAGKGFGDITGAILWGGDDSIVPLHSACGSSKQEFIWSCSRTREMGGDTVAWTSGPSSLMPMHYPILMARDMHHTQNSYRGLAVPVDTSGTILIGRDPNGLFRLEQNRSSRTTGHLWWRRTINNYSVKYRNNETLVNYFIRSFRGSPAQR